MINIKYFEEISHGNEDIKNRLLGIVYKNLIDAKIKLNKEFLNPEFNTTANILHKLKPQFIMFNLQESFKNIDTLEQLNKQELKNADLHKKVIANIDEVIAYIKKILPNLE